GGDINEAFKVVLKDGRQAFVKTRSDAPPGEYAAEAAGLAWLAEPAAVRTPGVLDVDDRYLALEWVAPGQLDEAGEEELRRGLAAMHAGGAPGFGGFPADSPAANRRADRIGTGAGIDTGGGTGVGSGIGIDTVGGTGTDTGVGTGTGTGTVARFGSLSLSNEPTDDWPSFYAQRRLLPLTRLARDRDALSVAGVEAVERVCERLPELAGPPEKPARLHGDLWQGNVMADTRGRPWLIDPSAYGGHREGERAMLSLFGSSPERVLASYRERSPLADGWEERVGLYQLLPLLVHTLLFGGSYREAADRMALRYGR